MLKKKSINEVSPELRNLLLQNNSADVVIGASIYELYPFTTDQLFKFMKYVNEYNALYQETLAKIREKNPNANIYEFFAEFLDSIEKQNFVKHAIKDIQPNIDEEDLNLITYDQLLYFLTKVYELNFFRTLPLKEKELEVMNHVKKSLGLQI